MKNNRNQKTNNFYPSIDGNKHVSRVSGMNHNEYKTNPFYVVLVSIENIWIKIHLNENKTKNIATRFNLFNY